MLRSAMAVLAAMPTDHGASPLDAVHNHFTKFLSGQFLEGSTTSTCSSMDPGCGKRNQDLALSAGLCSRLPQQRGDGRGGQPCSWLVGPWIGRRHWYPGTARWRACDAASTSTAAGPWTY